MLGTAALAMWWDMAPAMRGEFEHWHVHEHFPERLALPGFLRASRWADAGGGEGFFVLYELEAYEALVSPEYLARLDAPTDWSRELMPHHRNMVRCPARTLARRGGAIAGHALTVRFTAGEGESLRLEAHVRELVDSLPGQPGLGGACLLRTDLPAIAPTTEQRIRGLADRAADGILVVTGYDEEVLQGVAQRQVSPAALTAAGAAERPVLGRYRLCQAMDAREARVA